MKRILEWQHRYIPYLAMSHVALVLLYLLVSMIYLKQLPVFDAPTSQTQFEEMLPCMRYLYEVDMWVVMVSLLVSVFWFIYTILGLVIYKKEFELNITSILLLVSAFLFHMMLTDNSWYYD